MARRVVHFTITGRVQGVGYRAFVESEAVRRGLDGWVRNCSDGAVEGVFAGESETVAAMIAACREGPAMARVDDVVVETRADELTPGFAIRRTE
jgi:acylphosphatase